MKEKTPLEEIYTRLVIDDEGRACKDIPEAACNDQPRNFLTHVASLFLSKSSDGLIDPKLVLSWLVTALGGSSLIVGLLVPIREAGALLPQLFTAGAIRKLPLRKYAWAVGSFVQGLSAITIGVIALIAPSQFIGWYILAALTVLALARSVCSVSYKDVLGKTVAKSRRGSATGLAGSLSAVSVMTFALLLSIDVFPRLSVVITGLFIAGGLWIAASVLFITLKEDAGAVEGGKSSIKAAIENLAFLKTEAQLQRFIIVRALLTATALAPPFMVAGANSDDLKSFGGLGVLVIASAMSTLLSSFIWGRLADRSSRKVLIVSAYLATIALIGTATAIYFDILSVSISLPVLLFALMIAYQGVRLGRSTHLVDMAEQDTRAAFTALSNTIIGIVLILGGFFGLLSSIFGIGIVIGVMAVMCLFAAFAGYGLEEVQ